MRQATVEIRNEHGLHARPAALFVRAAGSHKSSVKVRNVTLDGQLANAKSIIEVLKIGVSRGHTIELVVEGPDEDVAIDSLCQFIQSGAGESLESQAPNG